MTSRAMPEGRQFISEIRTRHQRFYGHKDPATKGPNVVVKWLPHLLHIHEGEGFKTQAQIHIILKCFVVFLSL